MRQRKPTSGMVADSDGGIELRPRIALGREEAMQVGAVRIGTVDVEKGICLDEAYAIGIGDAIAIADGPTLTVAGVSPDKKSLIIDGSMHLFDGRAVLWHPEYVLGWEIVAPGEEPKHPQGRVGHPVMLIDGEPAEDTVCGLVAMILGNVPLGTLTPEEVLDVRVDQPWRLRGLVRRCRFCQGRDQRTALPTPWGNEGCAGRPGA